VALVTRALVSFPSPSGQVDVLLEYDDVLLRATGVICNNPTSKDVITKVTRDSDGQAYTKVFGPGNTRLDIPTGPAGRIDLVINSRGGFDGYSFAAGYRA
jgi:hypothetical protein